MKSIFMDWPSRGWDEFRRNLVLLWIFLGMLRGFLRAGDSQGGSGILIEYEEKASWARTGPETPECLSSQRITTGQHQLQSKILKALTARPHQPIPQQIHIQGRQGRAGIDVQHCQNGPT